jgi:ribonucleoside-diphosphate reductase beta chain
MTQVEPILQENKNRFVIFRSNIMTFGSGKKMEASFGLRRRSSQDLNDWNNKLSDEERYFVKHILVFCCFGWDCKRKFGREFCKRGTIC